VERLQHVLQQFKDLHRPSAPQRNARLRHVPPAIRYTKTRTLEIPDSILRERRVLAGFDQGAFKDSYKILRTQVIHRLREHNWSVLAVTSPGSNEGKTLTATNLAISLAMETTQTVLLVDADLSRPSIHTLFGIKRCEGLTEYLIDDIPVEDLLIHPGIGRFVLMPGGRPIYDSVEALTSPKMVSLVEEFRNRYPARIVVFDLPPLLDTADVLAFSPYTDALLLVVEEGRTTVDDLERALALVRDHTPVLGTVLNKAGRRGLTPKAMRHMLLA
jgi:capsular exopolysaccharide synthesis family protein